MLAKRGGGGGHHGNSSDSGSLTHIEAMVREFIIIILILIQCRYNLRLLLKTFCVR